MLVVTVKGCTIRCLDKQHGDHCYARHLLALTPLPLRLSVAPLSPVSGATPGSSVGSSLRAWRRPVAGWSPLPSRFPSSSTVDAVPSRVRSAPACTCTVVAVLGVTGPKGNVIRHAACERRAAARYRLANARVRLATCGLCSERTTNAECRAQRHGSAAMQEVVP